MRDTTKSNNALMEALQAAGLPVDGVVDGKPRYVGILSQAQMGVAQPVVATYNSGGFDYLDKRVYPSVGEQLDMQYWDMMNGTTIWRDTITAIKDANPKPE